MSKTTQAKEEVMMAWAFERSVNAAMIANLKFEILSVNMAFLNLFELKKEELLGRDAGEVIHSRSIDVVLSTQIPHSLNNYGTWQGEVLNYTLSGVGRPCLLSIYAIYSPKGEKMGYYGFYIDLTEQKKMESQIKQGEKLSNIGESVASLLHEVRNPLSGISINVDMLESVAEKGKSWTEADIESIQLVSKEVKRLSALVRSTLSYARNTQLHIEKVILWKFFDEIKELLIYHANDASVELIFDIVPDDLWAMFDPDPMKQVILNLVQNAIQAVIHCHERFVRLSVKAVEDPKWRYISSSAKVLLFTIDNSGEPIVEKIAVNLFKPFFTSKAEGLGLGLAIASKIVRQHNGILGHTTIEEAPYVTRFTVALPIS